MGDTLRVGGELGIGQYLQGGAYTLLLQRDGNLVLSEPKGAVVWETKTQGLDVQAAVLQDDGNFVLYSPNGAVWSTDTNGKAADKLVVQADRNVVLYDKDDNPLWATQTNTGNPIPESEAISPEETFMGDTLRVGGELGIGQYLQGGAYRLLLQRDGNLVLSEPKGVVVWETKTQGLDVKVAVLQDDGNFVLYAPGGAVWSTDTNGKAVDRLVVQADRNVVLYDKDGSALWASQTSTDNPIAVD
ncbi:hypothetical protein [Streptomyces sp. NPDC005989]|uniref:hypothetical protein n=1 Tax=Streptomyces sp. NPDC005989 TaxID=3156727 RepID=UPI0033C19C4E